MPAGGFTSAFGLGIVGVAVDLRANAVAEDGAGNVVVVGSLQGTANFAPSPGNSSLTSGGNRDAFVAKYGPTGTLIWAETFRGQGPSSVGQASAVAIDGSGNIVVAGSFSGSVNFDQGNSQTIVSAPSRTDAFVAKLDSSGRLTWVSASTGTTGSVDEAYALALDGSGGVNVAGSYQNSATFGTTTLTATGSFDAFAEHLDASGRVVWVASTSGSGVSTAEIRGIAVDASGRLIMVGDYSGTVDFDPGPGVAALSSVNGTRDAAVWVLDASGHLAWQRGYGGTDFDQADAVAVDTSGNVYLTGSYSGQVSFNTGPLVVRLTATGIYDSFVAKLGSDGSLAWAVGFNGTNGTGQGTAIAIDPSGHVVVGGWFSGSADFDPGASTATLVSAGSTDAYVATLDATGGYLSAYQGGGSNADLGFGLAVNASGTVVAVGRYTGPATFGTTTLAAIGSTGLYVATIAGVAVTPPAPGPPQLQASSDTGASSSDGITSITSPVFDVTATSPGLLVQLLRDGTVVAARTGSGPLADPGIVPDGVHLYTTVQVNGTNVGPASAAVSLTIITRAPVTLIPGLLAGDETGAVGSGITSVNPPHLVGSTAANVTVQIIGMRGNVVASGTSSALGLYSILLPAFTGDGSYPFQARATDLAGNVGALSPTFTITLDTTAPVAPSKLVLATSDDSGTLGDSLTNVNRPHLTGTAEPGATVQLVGPSGVLGSTVAAVNGTFSVVPTSPLPDGSIALQARAIDLAGNIGPLGSAFTLIIDTTAPVAPGLPSLVPGDDSGTSGDNTTTVRTPRIAGSAEAGSSITLMGAGGAVLGSSVAGLNGAYVVSPSQPLPLGSNSLTVVATDLAGNRSGASPTLTLTLVVPPTAPSSPALLSTDDSGTLGDGLTNVNRPHFTGSGPVNATVRLIDAIGRTIGSGLVGGNGTYSIVPNLALADGPVSLTAIATDPFGNASPSSLAASFTIDTTPPAAPSALTLFAADDSATLGDRITNIARPRLTGTAEPLATITLLDASGRLVGQSIAGADGTFRVQPTSALAQGSITLHARSTDAAGNPSADGPSLTLSILLTPPAAPTAALLSADDSGMKGDGITNVRRFRLTGTAAVGVRVQVLDALGNVVANGTASSVDGSYTFATPAASAGTFVYRVRAVDPAGNSSSPSASVSVRVLGVAGDYDGDGKADVMTYNPAQALWSIRSSSTGVVSSISFGFAGLDVPVATDYNGTGRTILGVYRPTSSEWFLYDPTSGGVRQVQFGQPGDIPVPGDYDGIGRAEIAVYRPSTGQWLIQNPVTNTVRTVGFGWIGLDQPVPGDYDGTGRLQIAVYRPPFADWIILHGDGTSTMTQFGPSFDTAVPADYDGDGKADIAVYHPQTAQWFVLQSSNGLTTATQCGQAGVDQPVPADYDGVGRVNFANYRSPAATFFIRSNLDSSRSTPTLGTANASQAVLMPLTFRLKGVALLPVAQTIMATTI
jgi:hypothetical protein